MDPGFDGWQLCRKSELGTLTMNPVSVRPYAEMEITLLCSPALFYTGYNGVFPAQNNLQ